MDSRNTPYRSEVARWSPDELADYLRRLNFKDCEKVVRKYNITGQRFLIMSENDIQKFPKLSMPILSKLSQEIKRHEERKGLFSKRTHTQTFPDNTEYRQEEDDGWSSFDESDYESPDDQGNEVDVDYETPNDPDCTEDEADYEPPPSNDDDTHRNVVFPSIVMPATSEYIDRSKTFLQPPVPPKRPESSSGGRSVGPTFNSPLSNNESIREKSIKSFKPPPLDRTKKPPLDRSGPPFDRDNLRPGKIAVPEMSFSHQIRSPGAKLPKPPVPPTYRYDRNNPASGRIPPSIKTNQISERKPEMEDDDIPQRPVPQPSLQFFNTFPSRSPKPQPKQNVLPSKMTPGVESCTSSGSLPPHFQPSDNFRTFSKGPADGRPPLPIPSRQIMQFPKSENDEMDQCHKNNQPPLNQKWYAADITRPEAEVALRNINQDGTFLVRNSSRKTLEQPYVLMVLYSDKVYNIQIRYQQEDKVYFLGTGLKGNEDFSSVADIIDYFRRMPLRLIDGKDRCSRKQCMLTYVAGSL